MRRLGFLLTTLVALVLLFAGTAHAQTRSPDARRLAQGRTAEQKGEWEAALASYEAAFAAAPSFAAVEGLARVHYELGHDAEAFEAYAILAVALNETEAKRARVAERLGLLSPRVGLVVIVVTTPNALVDIDGKRVAASPLQQLTRRLSVGKHVVRVTSGAGPAEQREIDVTSAAPVVLRFPEEAKPEPPPSVTPKETPPTPKETPDVESPSASASSEPWRVTHGSRTYAPVRAKARPVIDGKLDDAAWKDAASDASFFSVRSKPYGRPTTEPTAVQVAYDEENLYVAVRCGYSTKRARDDTFSTDEEVMLNDAETFSVVVDPLHSHSNGFVFSVARVGTRADVELTESGTNNNLDWRGIWDVATQRDADGWTAEFKIPWGTMRLPRNAGPTSIGVNFRRKEPITGEAALWALHPPATETFDTNFFGHLEGLSDLRPSQRLYLQPYVAVALDDTAGQSRSPLTDMTGTGERLRTFAGVYARYQPAAPVRIDATFNPNFTGVTPDRALANFDRFELEYPEVRPFFAEDVQRFQFGGKQYATSDDPGAQLFYSRRIGLRTNTAGLTDVVPIIYGVKSVARSGGTEAAIMNVGLAPNNPRLSMQDNIAAARVSQTFTEGTRIGAIGMGRSDDNGTYLAGGVDGTLTLLDRHFALSGFLAQTKSDDHRRSGAGQLSAEIGAQDVYARGTHTDIGNAFDAQLGFFPITGVRSDTLAAGYTPVVRNDLIQRVFFEGQYTMARDRSDQRIYDRGAVGVNAETPEHASFDVLMIPSIEQVATDFTLANDRIVVAAGRYEVMVLKLRAVTAPRRPVVAGIGYETGDLFAGTIRAPSATLGLNLGRFTTTSLYRLYMVHYGPSSLVEHELSLSVGLAYTPLAKSTLVIETNTLSGRGLAQFITSYTFGALSTIALVVRGTSGSTIERVAEDWYDRPGVSAIVSFALGLTPI